MDPALHSKIQHLGWNKAAPLYDSLWRKQLQPAQRKMLSMAAIKSGENILDLCCGSGMVTIPSAKAVGPQGHVTGTDFAEEMLEIAQQMADDSGLKNTHFQTMDAEHLTFPSENFDVVLNALGLMYLTDPGGSICEMYRMLKPGGRAVALVWGARKNCGWSEVFPIVDKRVTSEVCPLFFQQGTGNTLRRSFEAAGFIRVEEHRVTDSLHYDNDNDASDAMFVGGPVALAWRHFDEDTRIGARQEYLDSLKAYKTGGKYQVPAEFLVVKGVKG
jgi:ubiquinone/menaquinone biosynthesis C-methylase UbiE